MPDLTREEAMTILDSSIAELQTLASDITGALWGLRDGRSEVRNLSDQISRSALQIRLEAMRISERMTPAVRIG